MKKITTLAVFVFILVTILTSLASAKVVWDKTNLSWTDGSRDKEIYFGETATFSTGDFGTLYSESFSSPFLVKFKVVIKDTNNNIISTVADKTIDVTKNLAQETIILGSSNYLKAGNYVVVVTISDPVESDSEGLYLTVKPITTPPLVDSDKDGIADNDDNCALTSNPDQKDTDNNGIGDACDFTKIPDIANIVFIDSDINVPPKMDSITSGTVKEEQTISFIVSASDVDNDNLTYEVEKACDPNDYLLNFGLVCLLDPWTETLYENTVFDSQSGRLTFKPTYDFVKHPNVERDYTLRFRAHDGRDYSEWEEMTITVKDVNRDPSFTADPSADGLGLIIPFYVRETGAFIAIDLLGNDPDGDKVSFLFSDVAGYGLPPGLGYSNNGNNLGSITGTVGLPGTYVVSITVSDGFGGRISLPLGFNFTAAPVIEDNDQDNDGIPDVQDNCPINYNPDQKDNDHDGLGDVCDSDDDNDGVGDRLDNCQFRPNRHQEDNDQDGKGDICDVDDDNDNVNDTKDNCHLDYNPDQKDRDNDGKGDVCDYDIVVPPPQDTDGDGIPDNDDNCPLDFNPLQEDTDHDGKGDICDNNEVTSQDTDHDGKNDDEDNCPLNYNPNQADLDHDGLGDVCDSDDDNDDISNHDDNCPLVYNPDQIDLDNDNIGDACDDSIDLHHDIRIMSVQVIPEEALAGEPLLLSVRLRNEGNEDLKDIHLTVLSYDLNLKISTSDFTFKAGSTATRNLEIPGLFLEHSGEYLVKITAGNGDTAESSYRLVYVK